MGVRSFVVDTTPLRVSRDFRLLWVGQGVSFLGSMITSTALPYQVFHETGSSLAVGLLGVAQIVPLVVLSVTGGAFVDSVDKRRMLLTVTVAQLACAAALAWNAHLAHPQVWLLYVLAALVSGGFSLSYPILRALLPLLVERELRPAAFALQSTYGTFGMMAGPAVAGLLIGGFGLAFSYGVDVVTYALALLAFARIAAAPPVDGAARASRASIGEGLRFLRGRPVIVSVMAVDVLAMVFGMPRALFPALAQRLGGGAGLYGLLYSAVAGGAFLASISSGWTGAVVRQGRAVLWCIAGWGAAIAAVAITRSPVLAVAGLAVAGGADMISGVFRSTIAADVTPDHLRGRVSGVEFAVYAGGPLLGDVEAGVVAALAGVPFAIASGGLACVVGAVAFAKLVPAFSRYDRRDAHLPVA